MFSRHKSLHCDARHRQQRQSGLTFIYFFIDCNRSVNFVYLHLADGSAIPNRIDCIDEVLSISDKETPPPFQIKGRPQAHRCFRSIKKCPVRQFEITIRHRCLD